MDTKTIQVNFPDGSIRDVEIAVYENTLITFYNDKIYQASRYNNIMYFSNNMNELKNELISCHSDSKYFGKDDGFVVAAASLTVWFLQYIYFKYNPDENDEIGTYIRANGLFGKRLKDKK